MSEQFIEGIVNDTVDMFFEINQAISNTFQQARCAQGQTLLILNEHLIRLCEIQFSMFKEEVINVGQRDESMQGDAE